MRARNCILIIFVSVFFFLVLSIFPVRGDYNEAQESLFIRAAFPARIHYYLVYVGCVCGAGMCVGNFLSGQAAGALLSFGSVR